MRKCRDGGKKRGKKNAKKKTGKKKKEKRRMKLVATTSLPAVDRPNADRWNAARSCQLQINCNCKSFVLTFDERKGLEKANAVSRSKTN